MSAERPSPVAWVVVVAGWVVMAVAVVGAWRDEGLSGDVPDWGAWLVGSALVHDGVLLPVVVVAGWLLSRGLPSAWRVPLRAGLVGLGLVALAVWPIAMRWGARDDNPSILPLPVARNLGLLAVAVAIGCLAWGTVRHRRHITDNDEGAPREVSAG